MDVSADFQPLHVNEEGHAMSETTGKAARPTAFVTGAASGIGRAIATAFVHAGYIVGGADIVELPADHEDIEAILLDVSSEDQWQQKLPAFATRHGRLDVLVNVAGILDSGSIVDVSPDKLMRMFEVNTKGVFTGCREAIPIMAASNHPCAIINIASANAIKAQSWTSAYAASKAAVVSLTRTTALHCAEQGYNIRVNAVLPGIVETPMVRNLIESSDDAAGTRSYLESFHPIKRLIAAEEIASVAIFLASSGASAITGASISADGGMTAG
jgi:3(or 17)beta-hydroxysteroid dehydrogenase